MVRQSERGLRPPSRAKINIMDEIEKLLEQIIREYMVGHIAVRREKLMNPIEIVENEQIQRLPCSVNIAYDGSGINKPDWKVFPSIKKFLDDYKLSLDEFNDYLEIGEAKILSVNAPKVSEQIDWEEL